MDRLVVRIAEATTGATMDLAVRLYLDSDVVVEIDWGDDTTTEVSGSGAKTTTHYFPSYGDYEITITQTDGDGVYSLGLSRTYGGGTNTGYSVTDTNPAILSAALGDSHTQLYANTFYQAYAMQSINLPSGLTSLGNYCFRYCYSLATINLPSGITSLGTYCFSNCSNMFELYCNPETPPTAGNSTSVPTSMLAAGKIYVPSASLEAYKTATYWSALANRMVGV